MAVKIFGVKDAMAINVLKQFTSTKIKLKLVAKHTILLRMPTQKFTPALIENFTRKHLPNLLHSLIILVFTLKFLKFTFFFLKINTFFT